MRLTFNGDDLQHAVLGVPVACGQDPNDLVYSDPFDTASELLDQMDWRTQQCGWAQCPQCRSAVLQEARFDEQFWVPRVLVAV